MTLSDRVHHNDESNLTPKQQLSTMLIKYTRPAPHLQVFNSSRGNDHNIWGNNSENDDDSLGDTKRTNNMDRLSPGQYFGARSLPLETMDELWQAEPQKQTPSPLNTTSDTSNVKSVSDRRSSSTSEPLWYHFRALPTSLHHRHQWKRHSTTTDEQISSIQNSKQRIPFYSLYPADTVTIQCQVSSNMIHTNAGHLTLTNSNSDDLLLFSIFSAKGNVIFDKQTGTVGPGQSVTIGIRPKPRVLRRLMNHSLVDESVAVLVGHDSYRLKVNLDMVMLDDDDDDDDDDANPLVKQQKDKHENNSTVNNSINNNNGHTDNQGSCPFCVLESLYPSIK
ncbi:hypothetical protein BC941DRAFT_445709 [Chlamydoabsidia padenii]|nr:hypothetical protein BC941DRAFT_445709 [Chlamydoabsidia padenii]